jgi:hypothetical protein
MAVARLGTVNPRPEIVLPPGFSLRIDYDPAASPTSLVVTAFKDERPVGQARLDPRQVGPRLRLDVEALGSMSGEPAPREPRLRLTPHDSSRAIEMGRVEREVLVEPDREGARPPEERTVLAETARETRTLPSARRWAPEPRRGIASTALNAIVWLENGNAVVLPSADAPEPAGVGSGIGEALRSLAERAAELLTGPLRLRGLEPEGWASWRASWRAIGQPAIAGDG